MNSATLQGVPSCPAWAQADALNYLKNLAAKKLPLAFRDYGGLSRQYVQESSGFV